MQNVLGEMFEKMRSHVGNLKEAAGRSEAGRILAIGATDLEKVEALFKVNGLLEEPATSAPVDP